MRRASKSAPRVTLCEPTRTHPPAVPPSPNTVRRLLDTVPDGGLRLTPTRGRSSALRVDFGSLDKENVCDSVATHDTHDRTLDVDLRAAFTPD